MRLIGHWRGGQPLRWLLVLALAPILALAPSRMARGAGGAEASTHPAPQWFQDGHLTAQAAAVLGQLDAASDYGLYAPDYRAPPLDALRAPADPRQPLSLALQREAGPALSQAALRFAHDLHFGRVDARAAGFALREARAPLDDDALLARLATARDPAAELAAVEPPFLHYRLLKAMLHRYRELAATPGLTRLPPLPARAVRQGDRYAGAPQLRRFLQALGDLPGGAGGEGAAGVPGRERAEDHTRDGETPDGKTPDGKAPDGETLDAALIAGLRQFQARHGLDADGVLAARTYRELTTPLDARVRQIELTLERWRWLPEFRTPPIIVNIPQFRLFAFRTTADHAADILQMPVIVGQAYRQKRTPVFVSELRFVVFRPYWDVPASIVRREMLGPMRANPAYLARNNLELVRGGGDDGAVQAPTLPNIEALASGRLRLRQRPGDDNALGLIKFVMPNDYGVYLHSTPARHLFSRARRDFSHGCIRLSDPVALAVHVLRPNPGDWSAAAVEAAMHGPSTQRLALTQPVEVMVLYGTALATEAGRIMFFDDLYGHDRRLEALLRARRAATSSGR
jgi:L,D-transpeptidase YcbB